MSNSIDLPIGEWTRERITAIIKAISVTDFDEAFDAFVSKDAQITINGHETSRDDLRWVLIESKAGEKAVVVTYPGIIEVPATEGDYITAGVVGIFYNTIIAEEGYKLVALDASINVVIEQDTTITSGDKRRVKVMNKVTAHRTVTSG